MVEDPRAKPIEADRACYCYNRKFVDPCEPDNAQLLGLWTQTQPCGAEQELEVAIAASTKWR